MSAFSSNVVWYLMRGSGVVSLVLLTAVLVLGIATLRRWRPARMPRFVTASLHRVVSLLAIVFLAVHIATAVADPYAVVGIAAAVVPFVAGRSAMWVGLGALSADLTAALVITSLLRGRIAPSLWRAVHWLAYAAWPLAVAHSFGVGSDSSSPWFELIGAVCVASVLGSVLWRVAVRAPAKHLEPRTVSA